MACEVPATGAPWREHQRLGDRLAGYIDRFTGALRGEFDLGPTRRHETSTRRHNPALIPEDCLGAVLHELAGARLATNFDASLRAYIAAGREGALDAQIVERLLEDLDAIKAFSGEGNEVKISFDDLVPLFDMVIAHTSRLAEAYNVEVEDLDEQGDSEDGVVVSLRRHLEAQKTILGEAS